MTLAEWHKHLQGAYIMKENEYTLKKYKDHYYKETELKSSKPAKAKKEWHLFPQQSLTAKRFATTLAHKIL